MASHSKTAARRSVQERLNTLSDGDFHKASGLVYKSLKTLLLELCKDGKVSSILTYGSLNKWREVDLSLLQLDSLNVRVDCAPNIVDAPLTSKKYDIILVPLYGFNEENYRLGHGGGWYDRLLAMQPEALKIGIGLEVNRIDFDPDGHDIAMDIVITDRAENL